MLSVRLPIAGACPAAGVSVWLGVSPRLSSATAPSVIVGQGSCAVAISFARGLA